MSIGLEFAPFIGEWDAETFYYKGNIAYLDGALYQATVDTIDSSPTLGVPWADVTALPVEIIGDSYDPTADDGIPAALGSKFIDPSAGVYFKTDTGDTDWTIVAA